MFYSAPGTNQY